MSEVELANLIMQADTGLGHFGDVQLGRIPPLEDQFTLSINASLNLTKLLAALDQHYAEHYADLYMHLT